MHKLWIHQSANDEIVHHPIKHPPVKGRAIPISRFQPKCSHTAWEQLCAVFIFFIFTCAIMLQNEHLQRQHSSPRCQNAHAHITLHCLLISALNCQKDYLFSSKVTRSDLLKKGSKSVKNTL